MKVQFLLRILHPSHPDLRPLSFQRFFFNNKYDLQAPQYIPQGAAKLFSLITSTPLYF